MTKEKIKKCRKKICNKKFIPFLKNDGYCSYQCYYDEHKKKQIKPKKPINRVSKKQGSYLRQYSKERVIFLSQEENYTCFIEGCNKTATTIEHVKGRKGYADAESRLKDIPLLLDQRFWKPCCLGHNLELENNSKLSKTYQLSKIHDGKKI